MTGVLIVRAEPGASASAARVAAAGLVPLVQPLFAIRAIDWTPPPAGDFDALICTSAQAPALAGAALAQYLHLPAFAVGSATAVAMAAAGLPPTLTGTADAASLVKQIEARGHRRILWLCGRDHIALEPGAARVTPIPCYAAEQCTPPCDWGVALDRATLVLVHSARSAQVAARAIGDARAALDLIAISAAAAEAAGPGWRSVHVAPRPNDAAMVALATQLCQKAAGSHDTTMKE